MKNTKRIKLKDMSEEMRKVMTRKAKLQFFVAFAVLAFIFWIARGFIRFDPHVASLIWVMNIGWVLCSFVGFVFYLIDVIKGK
ncbi:MAG TPA: hypothetical protein ENI02_03070 [Candidatus Aminicenantes bacterium]|nr:hypothetical protein [Candidatus Aminicenantes bacterium]